MEGAVHLTPARRSPARDLHGLVMDDPSQVERTYQEVKTRIVEGRYRPGVHLSESMLARLHKTSRTPVREALSRLLQEGYVELTPGRGYAVRGITVTLIKNMFQVRRLLEGAAAASAAELATAQDLEHLTVLADVGYVPGNPATHSTALANNLRFHLTLAAASHNSMLVDLVRQCLTQMDRVLSLGIDYAPFQEGSCSEHNSIVGAIRVRDPAKAQRSMELHLDNSRELLMQAVMRGDVRDLTV
jgi:DNA-binding GntR family transcriptional regulator